MVRMIITAYYYVILHRTYNTKHKYMHFDGDIISWDIFESNKESISALSCVFLN